MNQTVLALVVGVLGGVCGAYGATLFGSSETDTSTTADSTDLSELVLRLDRIESALGRPALHDAPGLKGSGDLPPSAVTADLADARLDALVAKLEERLRPSIQESVKASVTEAMDEGGSMAFAEAEPAKKKATLAEAAAEIGLTADEEESVRRIARETSEEFLKILAGKDGSVDDIRREFEDAKDDPKKRGAVTAKYMGKVMTNLGGLIGVGLSHQTKMREALGAEKASKLEDGYDISDLDPLGLEAAFDFD
ncbi:MAG: hypothetical protein P1V36_02910 [Planctomycetota bacterium]|nr:hypothetical protein [Planctomycetota bacterium]